MPITSIHPFNVFQFCPRCGKKSFTPSGTKSMHCKACTFEFFLNPAAAVAAIIHDANNKVLFTLRNRQPAKGSLDLPGGFVDPEETAEQALIREIREELNLTIADFHFFHTYWNHYEYGGLLYNTTDMVFICKVEDFSTLTMDDEVSDVIFRPIEEVSPKEIGLQSIRQAVSDYQKEKKQK